jgi:hypothetical protein
MSNRKIDHVPELSGASSYHGWSKAMSLVLQSAQLWCYVSSGVNVLNPINLTRTRPMVTFSSDEDNFAALLKWQAGDAEVRELLLRRMSATVKAVLPSKPTPQSVPVGLSSSESSASNFGLNHTLSWADPQPETEVTARNYWIFLREQYDKVDVTTQMALRKSLLRLSLKGLDGLDEYVGAYTTACDRFERMGVAFSDAECIFLAMEGLPNSAGWLAWRRTIRMILNGARSEAQWDFFVTQLYTEVQDQLTQQDRSHRPDVANVAASLPFRNFAAEKAARAVLVCSNTKYCGKTGHTIDQCFAKGGKLEHEPRPAWYLKGRKGKESVAVAADAPMPAEVVNMVSHVADHLRELSCAVVEEVLSNPSAMPSPADYACIMQQHLSTLLDSGCTSHLITNSSFFHTYDPAGASNVTTANHGILSTKGRGTCYAIVTFEGRKTRIKLKECLHVPGAVINLLSVGQMVEAGFGVSMKDMKSTICSPDSSGNFICMVGPMMNRLFFADLEFERPQALSPEVGLSETSPESASFACVQLTRNLWHARLGHAGGDAVNELPLVGTGVVMVSSVLDRCEPCIIAKHARDPHPAVPHRVYDILELVHADLCSPFPTRSPRGEQHALVMLDDGSNYNAVECMWTKDQAFERFKVVIVCWELQTGKKLKFTRTDGGGNFVNGPFRVWLEERGVVHQITCPYSHQQNGKAERMVRTLEDRAMANLYGAGLSSSYWADAFKCAGVTTNVGPTRTLPRGKSAYESFKCRKPDLSHLRIFGCHGFARVPLELQCKGAVKSIPVTFVGYEPGVKGWLVRDKSNGWYFTSRDVIFDENMPSMLPAEVVSEPLVLKHAPPVVVPPLPQLIPPRDPSHRNRILTPAGEALREDLRKAADHLARTRAAWTAAREANAKAASDLVGDSSAGVDGSADVVVAADEGINFAQGCDEVDVGGEWLAGWAADGDFNATPDATKDEFGFITLRSERARDPSVADYNMGLPPANLKEAALRPDWDTWKAAANKELATMKSMGVYELCKLPCGHHPVGCRWVLEYKVGPDGELIAKAQLVAQGYSQIPGLNFSPNHTFAAVTKTSTVRFVAAYAAAHDWELDAFDATRAFLWGVLEEPVYMTQPVGFVEGVDMVWRLLRSVYGLKQASHVWYKKLRGLLERLGFCRSEVDHALFIAKLVHSGVPIHCLMAVHVDDGMAAANSRAFLDWVKAEIRKEFGLKDLGPVAKFLGMEFKRNRATRELWISQVEYIDSILAEYGLTDCNPVHTPIDPLHPWGRPTDNLDAYLEMSNVLLKSSYQRIVGHLLFLVLCTRPDGQASVRLLSQFCSSPEVGHMFAAKCFLRYLKGTRTLALHYGGVSKDDPLAAHCDADWANDPADQLSISGYVWSFAGGPISWASKKQTTHALASTDAEYMAISEVFREGLWLLSQGCECVLPFAEPLTVQIDNTGAIAISRKSAGHSRTKHIDVRYHFIREHVDSGLFDPQWVSTSLNVADIFTKSLPRPAHTKFVSMLSLVPL